MARTKEWVAMAAGRLKVLVKEIATVVSHSNWRVRLSLADGAATLLKTCARYVLNSLFAAGVLIISAADKGHFLVVTPPHPRTSYSLFFLEDGCIGSWKRMVVSLSSL